MARVLVIDDDLNVRRLLRNMLEKKGHEIVEALDGDEGLRYYRLQRADLVITDILMPAEDGLSTINEIRRESPDAKIIAISGGGERGDLDFLSQAEDLGALRTISKPFTVEEVLGAVNDVLGRG